MTTNSIKYDHKTLLLQYSTAMKLELQSILQYWMQHCLDEVHGGFYGKIDHANTIYPTAEKGAVLNSRILWAFSSAYNLSANPTYLQMADRAYQYFIKYFIDPVHGGVYWLLKHNGEPTDTKKQTYATAFGLYALSEYYKCNNNEAVKEKAIALYNNITEKTFDHVYGGYFEAFTRDWLPLTDQRLSEKDANEKKSMNTHLHVIEAFANLYSIWPNETLKNQMADLLHLFDKKIIDNDTHQLHLFFKDDWSVVGDTISFGHDIEAAWLLLESAQIIQEEAFIKVFKERAVKMAQNSIKGLDIDGGLWYEMDVKNNHWIREKHSWPQAEAMVGFFNAWELNADEAMLQHSLKAWAFVQEHIKDDAGGEWVWGVKENYEPMLEEDKVGIWKCPYHNSRACIEIIHRINHILINAL